MRLESIVVKMTKKRLMPNALLFILLHKKLVLNKYSKDVSLLFNIDHSSKITEPSQIVKSILRQTNPQQISIIM